MPDTPTQTTGRELLALAGRLHEAYQQAEPGHRLYAAAQAADEWARERYGVSIELLRQHAEMTERMKELDAAHDRAASLADRVMVAEGERDRLQGLLRETRGALGTYVNTARTMSGEYEQRIAELEAAVPEWQESVDEVSAEAQNFHRLYARELGKVAALEARLADYDHQAEQAETYRRLYAQTLRSLEKWQGARDQAERRADRWVRTANNYAALAKKYGHEAEQQEKRIAKLERRAERAELQEQLLRDALRRANEEVQHGE